MTTKAIVDSKRIEAFRKALGASVDNIVEASRIYVEALDENPRNAEVFADKFRDFVPPSAWSRFEAVGRKWMHPKLLMGGMADRKKGNIVKRLPYSLQERIFDRERFALLLPGGDTMQIDVLEATVNQADQLCNKTGLRSQSEQKSWLEEKFISDSLKKEHVEVMPYTIGDGRVSFRRNVSLTRAEVRRLLQEM